MMCCDASSGSKVFDMFHNLCFWDFTTSIIYHQTLWIYKPIIEMFWNSFNFPHSSIDTKNVFLTDLLLFL